LVAEVIDVESGKQVTGIGAQAAYYEGRKTEPPRAIPPERQHCGWMGQGERHSL